MSKNSTRFLNAYSQIEMIFKKWNQSDKSYSFSNYVHYYAKRNYVVSSYRSDLLEFAQLRNAIVHNRINYDEVIAEPHEVIVRQIEAIAQLISQPKLLSSLNFRPLISCYGYELLSVVLARLNEYGYLQLPVVEQERIVNILDAQLIVRFLARFPDKINSATINDVLKMSQKRSYATIQKERPIYEAIALFEESQKVGNLLAALIIVNQLDKPVALLTAKDIPWLSNQLAEVKR